MKVAIVADVHVTNPKVHPGPVKASLCERAHRILDVLRRATAWPGGGRCDMLIVAGDLFDTCYPIPQLVYAVGEVFRGVPHVRVLLGNHDVNSAEEGDNACRVLELAPNVKVIDKPIAHFPFVFLPHPYDYRDLDGKGIDVSGTIVVAHHGISDDAMAAWTRDKGAPVTDVLAWLDQSGAYHYLAGDWHQHRSWCKGRVQQIGALAPVNWKDPGIDGYGTVIRVNTSIKPAAIPGTGKIGWRLDREHLPGPRFVISSSPDDLPDVKAWSPLAAWLYVRAGYVLSPNAVPPGTVVESASTAKDSEGRVREAAEHVSDTSSVEDHVVSWVMNDQNIPQDMKFEVIQKVLQHLGA